MAKGKGKQGSEGVKHREEFLRINFLYQAAALMTAMVPASIDTPAAMEVDGDKARPSTAVATTITPRTTRPGRKPRAKSRPRATSQSPSDPKRPPLAGLGRFYVSTLKGIAKRSVLRLDPTLKRTICRRCQTLLMPGVSATTRIEETDSGEVSVIETRCQYCQTKRRMPTQPAKRLFSEGDEHELIES